MRRINPATSSTAPKKKRGDTPRPDPEAGTLAVEDNVGNGSPVSKAGCSGVPGADVGNGSPESIAGLWVIVTGGPVVGSGSGEFVAKAVGSAVISPVSGAPSGVGVEVS
jgi:hypothetical protein